MSSRSRTIAAAPVRTPAEAWAVIEKLIIATLGKALAISGADVEVELRAIRAVGPMLVAGGHLERKGLELVAASLELTVTTAAGGAALSLEENLNALPGAAEAVTWDLYLPESPPLTAWLADAIRGHAHLHVGSAAKKKASRDTHQPEAGAVVDLKAFSRRKETE